VRLFFALELPAEVQAALGRLRPAHDDGAYRWVEPHLLHVTLAFLGEQPAEMVPRLEGIAAEVARGSRPSQLRLGEAGSFGPPRAPRVLWIGLGGDLPSLQALQTCLDGDLRQAGVSLEGRAFRPHITLARRRERAGASAPPAWPPRLIEHLPIPLDAVVLFESRLSPRGPSYTPVCRVRLSSTCPP